jgi:hypothetical protein
MNYVYVYVLLNLPLPPPPLLSPHSQTLEIKLAVRLDPDPKLNFRA